MSELRCPGQKVIDPAEAARLRRCGLRWVEIGKVLARQVGRSAMFDPAAVSAAVKRNGDAPNSPIIPGWVHRAGLAEDFADVLADQDEFAASAHCRRLVRDMRERAS